MRSLSPVLQVPALAREQNRQPALNTMPPGHRIRVDGKFFRRQKLRFRMQGAPYGPFAADASCEPFPPRRGVESVFKLMPAAAITSLRLYHPPPQWLLEAA